MERHILVVDDDMGLRETLQATLESEGYLVTIACDGIDALEKMRTITPALIILDLMMPRMDGYTFTKVLEDRGLRPSIPLLVLTADGRAKQKVREMNFDSFLRKPFEITDLLDEVERLAQ